MEKKSRLTRRTFLLGMLSTGYALAADPVADNIVRTGSNGLTTGQVEIPVRDGKIPAYFARPAKPGRYPVILVIHEAFGVHEHIQDVCRRYAHAGYVAVAPELFVRHGNTAGYTDVNQIFQNIISRVSDEQVNQDLDATLTYARKQLNGHKTLAGAVGYCWGGRAVWEYAYHNPKLTAGLAYYGRVEGMVSDERPLDPVDFGSELKVPVLGLYAEKDTGISLESVARMQAELKKSSSGSEIVVLPGVGHAFNADYRANYNKAAADKAWALGLAWFRKHGMPGV
ncbi:MAG: dienelactone hydrolase family protein [Rhodocyclaceae bacterium]|nr:dienelactone hydrolase family protein [Rhodocyclaceae bacterium]